MGLNEYQLAMLAEAADRIVVREFEPYLRLKAMLSQPEEMDREAFEKLFTRYYVLNAGGVTETFKRRFFELLFECDPKAADDPYTPVLLELYELERRKGDRALQCSFVSKLVAIHDESRPIYDKHVGGFFGLYPPAIGSVEFRIAGFLANLQQIQASYQSWVCESCLLPVLDILKAKHQGLEQCHPTRLCDFLVWTVGRLKISQVRGDVLSA